MPDDLTPITAADVAALAALTLLAVGGSSLFGLAVLAVVTVCIAYWRVSVPR